MGLFRKNKEPDEVFTPRRADVNDDMYIDRPELEHSLLRAVGGTQHILISGHSGTGKSWLYNRVFTKNKVYYEVANLAIAAWNDSLPKLFEIFSNRAEPAVKKSITDSTTGSIGIGGTRGELEHSEVYEIGRAEPFDACLQSIRAAAGKQKAFLVFDNLEAIDLSFELKKHLGNTIILLDDKHYARHSVKLLIVGVPIGIREYFSEIPNLQSVANRLYELPEVKRLDVQQVQDFVHRGFEKQLGYILCDKVHRFGQKIYNVTDGVPQRLHEYCLELAHIAKETAQAEKAVSAIRVTPSMLYEANERWVVRNLSKDYSIIKSKMNDVRCARGNQVLFALGQILNDEFSAKEIEQIVRRHFSRSTNNQKLNVGTILSKLLNDPTPIIKSVPRSKQYSFVDPRFRMCIRAMLVKIPAIDGVGLLDLH